MISHWITKQFNRRRRERWLALVAELRAFEMLERRMIEPEDTIAVHRLLPAINKVAESYRR